MLYLRTLLLPEGVGAVAFFSATCAMCASLHRIHALVTRFTGLFILGGASTVLAQSTTTTNGLSNLLSGGGIGFGLLALLALFFFQFFRGVRG